MHIRKSDQVVVIRGANKGRRGRVLRVQPKKERVFVEGVNMRKHHEKSRVQGQSGGIIEREAPIHISNVMAWCASAGKPSKIYMKELEDGTRVRVYKVNDETLND